MIIPQFGKESRKLGRVNFRKGFWNCYYLGTSSLLVSIVANDQSRSQSSSATSPVKLVGKICWGKFALGSKPPLVTLITRTGLGTRLVRTPSYCVEICLWSSKTWTTPRLVSFKTKDSNLYGIPPAPVVIVKKVPAHHHLPRTFIQILCYQGVHMQDKEHTESTGKICIYWFFLFRATILYKPLAH